MGIRLDIKIFVMPVGACSHEKSWEYAVNMISNKLKDRFGEIFEMKLIEIFSSESFSYEEIMQEIQAGKFTTPVVTLNGRIIQSGGKLSEPNLRMEIEKEKSILI